MFKNIIVLIASDYVQGQTCPPVHDFTGTNIVYVKAMPKPRYEPKTSTEPFVMDVFAATTNVAECPLITRYYASTSKSVHTSPDSRVQNPTVDCATDAVACRKFLVDVNLVFPRSLRLYIWAEAYGKFDKCPDPTVIMAVPAESTMDKEKRLKLEKQALYEALEYYWGAVNVAREVLSTKT